MYNSWNKGVRAIYNAWELFEKIGSINFDTLKVSVLDKVNHKYLNHSLRKEVEILINDLNKKEQTEEIERLIKRLTVFADYSAQSKTGRFLFNKPSIRGRKVGLLSSFLHTLYIFLLNVCIS